MLKSYTFHVTYVTGRGLRRSKKVDVEALTETNARALATALVHSAGKGRSIVTATLVEDEDPFDGFTVGQRVRLHDPKYRGMATIVAAFETKSRGAMLAVEHDLNIPKKVGLASPARLRELMQAPETVIYKIIYPTGEVYESTALYRSSQYGLDQLVQIKITKRGDKIIKKEIV